jgi:PleD family two-component response regulator
VPVSIKDYERFVATLKRLRLEVTTAQHEFEDALYSLDPLTGTPSRVGMLTKLREQHELVKRNVQACSVAMMDLDRFKAVNDKYGHAVGDMFRYGGEEFLICLPDTELETGHDIVDRLRAELVSLPHETDGKGVFHVSVSIGLTLLDSDISVEQAIDRADKALYVAKAQGRNCTVIWDGSMNMLSAEPERS